MRNSILFCLLFVAYFKLSIQAHCDQEILSIVMVVDASWSVGPSDFSLAKSSTIEMVQQMNVGPNKVHVGYVVYDTYVEQISSLVASEQNRNLLIANINAIDYARFGSGTATGDALFRAHQLFKLVAREFVPMVVVLLTDGYSNSGQHDVRKVAADLKKDKVDIFSVGITNYINEAELKEISSGEAYYMRIADYSQLYSTVNNITTIACDASAFIEPGQKATIESPPNQKRNFQTDLTKLRSQSAVKMPIIIIEMKVFSGLPVLTYSLNEPISSNTKVVKAEPSEERVNPDNSRTSVYLVYPNPGDEILYFSIVGSQPIVNTKYELSIRTL